MSNEPGDKPPPDSPYAPPAKPDPTKPNPEQTAAPKSAVPAPAPYGEPPREAPVAAHHAPIAYEPAQFPRPEGGPAAPYNPHGPPPGPPPMAGPGGGPGPGPTGPYAAPNAQQPYGAVPPPAQWQRMGYPPPKPFPGILWFLLIVVIGIFSQLILSTAGMIVAASLMGVDLRSGNAVKMITELGAPVFMGITFVASLAWPTVALVSARLKRILNRDTFRIRWPGWSLSSLSVLLGLALVPLALLMENLVARVIPRTLDPIMQVMTNDPGTVALILLGIVLVVCAPVGEELLFRGLGYGGIEKRYGMGIAALVVSSIFAAVHMKPSALLPLFMVSMALCWVTSKSNSLIPAILLHAAYNGIQFVMLLGSEKITPEKAKQVVESTELGLPIWMFPVAVVVSGACLLLIGKLGDMRAAAVD